MQEAYDYRDGAVYTALQMESLPPSRFAVLQGHLRCRDCHHAAHFRSRSSGANRRPCFFCRPHGDDCALISQNRDPWGDDDEGRINAAAANGGRLIVQIAGLDDPDEADNPSASDISDQRTRAAGRVRGRTQSNIRRGPQRILELLVSNPSFRTSPAPVRFRDGSELPVHSAFVSFQQANHELHVGSWRGFWGRLTSPSRWSYGSAYYFNFGPLDLDFRILFPDEHIAGVLERYGLESVSQLAGGWFMLFDVARISNSGRFTADVISPNYVGFIPAG
jgi:hypothetical protein